MKVLTVVDDVLNDLLIAARYQTYDYWSSAIEKNYPSSVIVDHPLVDHFKFFTTWPATMVFYVDPESNTIMREPLAVRSKSVAAVDYDEMFSGVDFNKAVLLGVFRKAENDDNPENLVVRYALATHDILPYKSSQ
jgi:hypothetical protein